MVQEVKVPIARKKKTVHKKFASKSTKNLSKIHNNGLHVVHYNTPNVIIKT